MSQSSGFDMSKISTAGRILMIAGVLYLIDLFLPWQHACISLGTFGKVCGSQSGWHGIGILNGILVILILVMEALIIAQVEVNVGTPAMRNTVEAGLAAGLLLFTIIKILVDHEDLYFWAWIGLILALVISYGGYMRYQERNVMAAPPTTPPTTPPTAPPPTTPGGGYNP
jgi:hypothetical protein